MLKIYDFSVDYIKEPSLVRTKGLRFGWQLDSDRKNVLQSTYRIVISNENGIAADTGTVTDTAFFDITIPDLCLASRTDYTVTVTVTVLLPTDKAVPLMLTLALLSAAVAVTFSLDTLYGTVML